MQSRPTRYCLAGTLLIGMLLALAPVQEAIHKARPDLFDPNRRTRRVSAISVGPTPAVIAALGGFRTVAADLLWLKAEDVWHGGSWWALLPMLETITQLDPHFALAWKVYGWHCAYNLHAESRTAIDKHYWLQKGIEVLERAVDANPKSWDIAFELGWTYFDRLHQLYQAAEWFYRADHLKGAAPHVSRLYYHTYVRALDLDKLWPALEYARKRHPEDERHQFLVEKHTKFWQTHWNDPQAHAKIIRRENTDRYQRGIRKYYLYPDNPFWDVCPACGMPSPKGSATCQNCSYPLRQGGSGNETVPKTG